MSKRTPGKAEARSYARLVQRCRDCQRAQGERVAGQVVLDCFVHGNTEDLLRQESFGARLLRRVTGGG